MMSAKIMYHFHFQGFKVSLSQDVYRDYVSLSLSKFHFHMMSAKIMYHFHVQGFKVSLSHDVCKDYISLSLSKFQGSTFTRCLQRLCTTFTFKVPRFYFHMMSARIRLHFHFSLLLQDCFPVTLLGCKLCCAIEGKWMTFRKTCSFICIFPQ